MRLLEAYTPVQVRAAGRMVKAIQLAGGKAEDILRYAAEAEANARNPIFWKKRFVFEAPTNLAPTKDEILGACGYEMLRSWLRVGKELCKFDLTTGDIFEFVREERKKDLASTKFGRRQK